MMYRFSSEGLLALLGGAALALYGCASAPEFDTQNVDSTLIPSAVVEASAEHQGKHVIWGGVIVNTTNLESTSQIEVLAYPLGSDYRPKLGQPPLGRFYAVHPGYLEAVTFAAGRNVSLLGSIAGVRAGRVGETSYTYPVVEVEQIHLWPKDDAGSSGSRVHFGIGVVFH